MIRPAVAKINIIIIISHYVSNQYLQKKHADTQGAS
jgi:hypothetical protein